MPKVKNINKVTVQGLNNPVPAGDVDLLTSRDPSSSRYREQQSATNVGVLAFVAERNATSTTNDKDHFSKSRGGTEHRINEKLQRRGNNASQPDEPTEREHLASTYSEHVMNLESSKKQNSTKNEQKSPSPCSTSETGECANAENNGNSTDNIAKTRSRNKQLSGAQRRKLARMRRKGLNVIQTDATKESPPLPTSSELTTNISFTEKEDTGFTTQMSLPIDSTLDRCDQPSHFEKKCYDYNNTDSSVMRRSPDEKNISYPSYSRLSRPYQAPRYEDNYFDNSERSCMTRSTGEQNNVQRNFPSYSTMGRSHQIEFLYDDSGYDKSGPNSMTWSTGEQSNAQRGLPSYNAMSRSHPFLHIDDSRDNKSGPNSMTWCTREQNNAQRNLPSYGTMSRSLQTFDKSGPNSMTWSTGEQTNAQRNFTSYSTMNRSHQTLPYGDSCYDKSGRSSMTCSPGPSTMTMFNEEENTAQRSFPSYSGLNRSYQDPHAHEDYDYKAGPSSLEPGHLEKNTRIIRRRKRSAELCKTLPSYAKAARKRQKQELCYAVIDMNSTSGKIPAEHQKTTEDLVNNKILDHLLQGGDPIEILNCKFRADRLIINFASSSKIEVLKNLIDTIAPPWEGANLKLVRKTDIHGLTKATVFLRGWGNTFPNERILEIFALQNKTLCAKKWLVFHREERKNGTLLVLGIDKISITSLAKTKGMAFYVSNAVYFKIGKTRICEDQEESVEVANTQDNSNDECEDNIANSPDYWRTLK